MDQHVKGEDHAESLSESKPQDAILEGSSTTPPANEPASNVDNSGPADEASRLKELQADIRDQDTLERDITRQVPLVQPRSNYLPDKLLGR